MNAHDYIASGLLELYVYGILSEEENREIARLSESHPEMEREIVSIEKAILQLSSSFSPFLSAENFEKIRHSLELKYAGSSKKVQPRRNSYSYIGWAASLLLLLGLGYFYSRWEQTDKQLIVIGNEKTKLEETVVDLEIRNKHTQTAFQVVKDPANAVVALAGQDVSPQAVAKVYWNKQTKTVYIDASGLPEPPQGKVYQAWALKLTPLTPTSIGLLDNFSGDNQRFFAVENASEAEAFGITLEPEGGSASPTLEQLYVLGKV